MSVADLTAEHAAPAAPTAAAPASLGVQVGQHAQRGRKAVQQDFHGVCVPRPPQLGAKGIVAVVADGIGSSDVSQEASQAAVRAVLEDYFATSEAWSVKRSMQRVLSATNSWLHAQTQRSPYRHDHDRGYVCAIAVLVLKGRTAHLFHAGDVRIYRLHGDALEPLTQDHRVYVGGGQSYLSRALGFHQHLEVDYGSVPIDLGDTFLLASDGVYEHLPPADMLQVLRTHGANLDAAARHLVALAHERGSADNLTAQLLRVTTLPEHDAPEMNHLRAGLPVPPMLHPRTELDGYRIERALHGSHRSHVYLATDLATGRPVVLKTPSTELAQDGAALDRFMMEEWIARRVNSAHVLRTHESGRPRTQLYLAMEYVEGQTLAQWMRDHPAPELESVRDIVEQVARGLQAFHRLEMLHQDLRPENIMIDRSGTVKIIDFGSVHVAGLADAAADRSVAILGTLQYTAPEYFLGEPGSERSDLFSLGVLAYQMLSGRLPYGTQVATLRTRAAQQRLVYDSVLDDRCAIPAWIDAVLMKAVHPLPHKRHEALSEFVHDLRHPGADWQARQRAPLMQRHPLRVWQLTTLVLLLIVLVQFGLLQSRARAGSPVPASSFPSPTSKATS